MQARRKQSTGLKEARNGRSEILNPALHAELWKCHPLSREHAEGLGVGWRGPGRGRGRHDTAER
jgi:hypothetical protein